MINHDRKIALMLIVLIIIGLCSLTMVACDNSSYGSTQDMLITIGNANSLQSRQPTPNDIDYSLERYNLIRRAYWVNGQHEKANALICEVEKPLGYIMLFSGDVVVAKLVVDGKITSLNSYLTPDSEYYEYNSGDYTRKNNWLADVDGSYGENDEGIFFFTPEGRYWEWTGVYLYSDTPFTIDSPVLIVGGTD